MNVNVAKPTRRVSDGNLSPQKQWARETFKGVENSPKCSFTADLKGLDEDGIRLDVRHWIANGFFSTMLASTYTTMEEKKEFNRIVCDEAKGKMLIGVNLFPHTVEEAVELITQAEAVGCTHAFARIPLNLDLNSEEDVYRYHATICEATKLPICVFAADQRNMRGLHSSGWPAKAFERIADIPNVVAIKLTQPIDIALAFEVCERLSSRLLVLPSSLASVPVLAQAFGIQWIGQWVVEAVQSPDKPYLVEFMNHITRGQMDKAMSLYWQMAPAYAYVHALQARFLATGTHPWSHINYYHWYTGGNGGLPRPSPKGEMEAVLTAKDRQEIRDVYKKIGIVNPNANDDEFVVGKANYAKGLRPSDVPSVSCYVP